MARPPNPDAPRQLLAAARAIFADLGVEQARVQDIAEKAGFSKAAFYLYFESKDAVFDQLVREFFAACGAIADRQHERFMALAAEIGMPTADDFTGHTERLCRFSALDIETSRSTLETLWAWRDVFACIERSTGERRLLADQLVADQLVVIQQRLAEGAAAGVLRANLDAELLGQMILGIYLQLTRRMLHMDAPPNFTAWALQIDALMNHGIHPSER